MQLIMGGLPDNSRYTSNAKSDNTNNSSNKKSDNTTYKQSNEKNSKNYIWLVIGILIIVVYLFSNNSIEKESYQTEETTVSEVVQPEIISSINIDAPITIKEDDTPKQPPKKINIPDNFLENAEINIIENPEENFKIYLQNKKYTVYFRKKNDIWTLDINGKEVVSDDHLIRIYEIKKNRAIGYYIFQTECGGSSCNYFSYYLLDLEHQTYSMIPLLGNEIDLEIVNQNIYVSGQFGFNSLGDPTFKKLVYYPKFDSENSLGYWIDPDLPPKYLSLFGGHPEKFFSDNELRDRMVNQLKPDLFRTIRERTSTSGLMSVEAGHLLIIKGCMEHSCSGNNAITIVDMMNDNFHSIYQVDNKFYSIGDIMADENMPATEKSHTIYQKIFNEFLSLYLLQIEISNDGKFQIKNI